MRATVNGFGLVEVLVAMLVVGTGLLGLHATMLMAHRMQQDALIRTQVALLAADIVERMRLNPVVAAQGAYDGSNYPEGPDDGACDARRACNSLELAVHDRSRWSQLFRAHLPGTARASVSCFGARAATFVPGDAICTLVFRWRAWSLDTRMAGAAWTFRP